MRKTMAIFMSIMLMLLCSCSNSKITTNSTAQNLDTTKLVLQTEPSATKDISYANLSYIMMYKIAGCYAQTCGAYEFMEGELVPYEAIFGYFTCEGCYTFDERMISPLVSPYFNEQDWSLNIPHEIVDNYLVNRFNTVPNPERIDSYADEFYNNETGCYEFAVALSGPLCQIDIQYADRKELRKNVYQFKARYFSQDDTPDDMVACSTFIIELNAEGYRILAHSQTKEKPSAKIIALRKLYAEQ